MIHAEVDSLLKQKTDSGADTDQPDRGRDSSGRGFSLP